MNKFQVNDNKSFLSNPFYSAVMKGNENWVFSVILYSTNQSRDEAVWNVGILH
jgi:hypothetical protein